MKRIISAILTVVIVLCLSAPFAYAENGRFTATDNSYAATAEYTTREQAAARFIKAVGIERFKTSDTILNKFSDGQKVSYAYREAMSAAVYSGLISGYEDKTLRPQKPITRAEALVILARALSRTELNEWTTVEFTDTPGWAKKQIGRLAAAGIVKGYGDGTLGAADLMTAEQVDTLCDRIVRVTGPMGDFYNYINEDWLESVEVGDEVPIWSDSISLENQVNDEISDIIFSLYRRHYNDGEDFAENSLEKKIINVYSAAANQGYRDKIGFAPVAQQLDNIEKARNISELLTVMAELDRLGFPTLIAATLDVNIYDTSMYLPSVAVGYTGLGGAPLSEERRDAYIEAYKKYIRTLFELAGEENPQTLSEYAIDICTVVASADKSRDAEAIISDSVTVYDIKEFKKSLKNIDIEKYFKKLGFERAKKVLVYNGTQLEAADELFVEKNTDKLKAYLKAAVLDYSAPYLTTDSFNAALEFNNFDYNALYEQIPADYAVSITQELLGWEIGSMYIDTYFPDNVKVPVLDMTKSILEEYERLINSCDVMTKQTRDRAVEKLRNIKVHAAYPDNIKEYFSDMDFLSIENGGNLMQYKMQKSKSYSELCARVIESNQPANKGEWLCYPQTVNAMYDPVSNSITIPAGILRAPYFKSGADFEENLGGIGTVIAHEISHAFDLTGSQFDANGNLSDWWTEADRRAFNEICKRVAAEYDGIKSGDGVVDGGLTVNENIADLAGMSCIVSLASRNGLNLEKVFRSYAKIWRTKMTPEYESTMLKGDSHSPAKVRVNRVLSNFEEFYTCFGVLEGDGMYIPEQKRIDVWD